MRMGPRPFRWPRRCFPVSQVRDALTLVRVVAPQLPELLLGLVQVHRLSALRIEQAQLVTSLPAHGIHCLRVELLARVVAPRMPDTAPHLYALDCSGFRTDNLGPPHSGPGAPAQRCEVQEASCGPSRVGTWTRTSNTSDASSRNTPSAYEWHWRE